MFREIGINATAGDGNLVRFFVLKPAHPDVLSLLPRVPFYSVTDVKINYKLYSPDNFGSEIWSLTNKN